MSDELIKYLPGYYKTSQVMNSIIETENAELQILKEKMNNTLEQFFVDSADFTLERWEKELGIPVISSKPEEDRKSVIKSKLRGTGTVTTNLIDNVVESYVYGNVDIIEQPTLYSFTVKFIDTKGIPPNLNDLQNAIEEIKPAHLKVFYEFTYNTHADLSPYTHLELSVYTHEGLRTAEL